MKLKVIWIGRNKSVELGRVCDEFIARIRRFVPMEIIEIKDPRVTDERKRMEAEGEKILSALDKPAFAVALDPRGRTYDSTGFSKFLNRYMTEDPRDLVFVVGGYGGLSEGVRKRADQLLSLSHLTFSHDLSRLVLLEQLYRALSIIRNHPYAR